MTLRDLEQIQHDVVDSRSRELVAEVVRCYEGGAYRASLVSLWVAVVADLTGKIRYLAESGDGEAKSMISDLDKALNGQKVDQVQRYEREILKAAEQKFEILLPRERVELERLNQDRNLCAHPGYLNADELFVPDAELVRAHLVAANRCVFSQHPLAGRRLIKSLENEIQGESWPSNGDYFLNRFFHKARESVKLNMAKVLVKISMRPLGGGDRAASRARCAALSIADAFPSLFEQALRSVLDTWESAGTLGDSELVRASGAYGGKSVLWSVIPETGKARLTALLDGCKIDFLLEEGFFISGETIDECIVEKFQEIVSQLNSEQLAKAIEQSMDCSSFVRPAIDLVRDSRNYREAEGNLRLVELCSKKLSPADVAHLCKAIQENQYDQVRLATGTESILSSIYNASLPTEESCREWRILAEWLHETGKARGDDYYLYGDFLRLVHERN